MTSLRTLFTLAAIPFLALALLTGCSEDTASTDSHEGHDQTEHAGHDHDNHDEHADHAEHEGHDNDDGHDHAEHEDHALGEHSDSLLPTCVVSGEKLGSMGTPVKVSHNGTEIQLCCDSCTDKFEANADQYVAKFLAAVKK